MYGHAPFALTSSLASVLLDAFAACLALDLAAPVERAFTLPASRVQPSVVPSSTAHRVAVVRRRALHPRRRSPVAAPAARSQRPDGRVQLTVARRRVEIDEMATHRFLVGGRRRQGSTRRSSTQPQEDGRHGAPAVYWFHATRTSVARRQPVTDSAEARQSDPARPHQARSRHAVTLALCHYRVAQRLQCTNTTYLSAYCTCTAPQRLKRFKYRHFVQRGVRLSAHKKNCVRFTSSFYVTVPPRTLLDGHR